MKKKIVISLGIILLLIVGLFVSNIISDLIMERKLIKEFNEISELANAQNIDIDTIYKRLNRIITKKDYAKVEEAYKNYLKENFDNTIKIAEILNDEKIVTILTAENYSQDGKKFIETKKYLDETITELEKCKQEYLSFFTEKKAMSYLNSSELDSYYIDLYKKEFVKDIETTTDNKIVENCINETIEILKISKQIINLLADNPNSWELKNDQIIFDNNNLANQYDNLINLLSIL